MPIERPDTDVGDRGVITQPRTCGPRKKMFQQLPYCVVPGLAPICCDVNDPDTVTCGFAKRLLRETPIPDAPSLAGLKVYVEKWLVEHVPKARNLGFEPWLETTSYNEARKNELRACHTELRGGVPTKKQCRTVKTHGKVESYPEYKHARLINSRSDFFKAFSGPLFKAIEEVVYALPPFIKHVPVPERPGKVAGLKRAGRHYYATDFTAYESHFVPEVLDAIELPLYRHCLSWCPDDAELICKTLRGTNCMRTRSGVAAKCKGRRMSGDMCTSLGNGFTNYMLASYICSMQGKELDGYVEGDDGLFSTEAVLDEAVYQKLGFTIKIEEVSDPCEASFCGMLFAASGEIVRDPIDFCANFGWTSSFLGSGRRIGMQLLRAKCLSAVYETPQCPVVGALARYGLSMTRGVAPRWVEDGYHRCPRDELPLARYSPSAVTRELVARRFGISVSAQVEIEQRVSKGDLNIACLLPYRRDLADFASKFVELG